MSNDDWTLSKILKIIGLVLLFIAKLIKEGASKAAAIAEASKVYKIPVEIINKFIK